MFLGPASDSDKLSRLYANGAVADHIQHLREFKGLVFPRFAGEDYIQGENLLAPCDTV